jgi:hypothetical protein
LEQRNKENRQKTRLQTTTCAKEETPKKRGKTLMQNQELKKIKKIKKRKIRTGGWFSSFF